MRQKGSKPANILGALAKKQYEKQMRHRALQLGTGEFPV
ncbi:protein of unknown function (plasmid) [Ralstonia solanacearum PSI07]|nr:protein of unknown function [Ralstonia solanacearum PSI07]